MDWLRATRACFGVAKHDRFSRAVMPSRCRHSNPPKPMFILPQACPDVLSMRQD